MTSRDDHTIRIEETQPTTFQIKGDDDRTLLTIHRDGTVEVGSLDDATEAARVFVREIGRMGGWVPGELLAAEQARNATLADTITRARALHTPHYEIDGVQHDYTVMLDPLNLPPDHVCRIDALDACRPDMEEHYGLACGECRQNTEDAEPGAPLWPCPTAEALDGPGEEDG